MAILASVCMERTVLPVAGMPVFAFHFHSLCLFRSLIRTFVTEREGSGPPVRAAMPLVQRMQSSNQVVSPVDADKCR